MAGTGEVGLGQRFCNVIESQNEILLKRGHFDIVKELSRKTKIDFEYTGIKEVGYAAIMGFTNGNEYHLCEFSLGTFQPEFKKKESNLWFTSMGCGQRITDPFLGLMRKIFWKSGPPSVTEAIFIATWTLQHAIELNSGGINAPIQMATIRKDESEGKYRASLIPNDELEEHKRCVEDAEEHLSKYKNMHQGLDPDINIPEIPKK